MEKELESDFDFPLPASVRFLQFVPDTLLFGEKNGVNYYEIIIDEQAIISTVAIRRR